MVLLYFLFGSYYQKAPQPAEDHSSKYADGYQQEAGYLQKYAEYCNRNPDKENNKWLHYMACEKSSEFVIAVFTIVLSVATVLLVVVGTWQGRHLRRSVDLAREEFISTHRPNIRVKHVLLTSGLWKDACIEIELVIVNCGSTTADITECNIATLIHRAGVSLPARPAFSRPRVIFPSKTDLESGITMDLPRLIDDHPLSDAENTGIRDLTRRLYCYGYVDYSDDVGKRRRTSFCRVLDAPLRPASIEDIGKFVVHEDRDYEYQD